MQPKNLQLLPWSSLIEMNTVNVLIASNQSSDDFSKLRRMLPENIQIIIPEKGTEEELVQLLPMLM